MLKFRRRQVVDVATVDEPEFEWDRPTSHMVAGRRAVFAVPMGMDEQEIARFLAARNMALDGLRRMRAVQS